MIVPLNNNNNNNKEKMVFWKKDKKAKKKVIWKNIFASRSKVWGENGRLCMQLQKLETKKASY